MPTEVLKIINAGIYTTIQDLGRRGYRKFGMPLSGPMDPFSHKSANQLVGNSEKAPCLEIVGSIFEAEFISECKFAIAGGSLSATLDNKSILVGKVYRAEKGKTLKFISLNSGIRVYLAVEGGFIGNEVLGSMSMSNKLTNSLILLRGSLTEKLLLVTPDFSYIKAEGIYSVKIRMGPDSDLFNKKLIKLFLNTELEVMHYYNRMGIRFNPIDGNWKTEENFVTKPVFPGCIQITPNGTPILIMNDGQTTGGYPVIAVIDKEDMKKAGQLKFGDRVIMHKLSKISDIINR